MHPSAEVRWFLEGPLPEDVLRWFGRVAGSPGWQTRTDYYARPSTPNDLNVKWREGNIEVKRLIWRGGEETLGPVAHAPVERWRKWSFPLADEALRDPQGDWVEVAKRRQVRHFSAEEGGVRPLRAGEERGMVCGVEIGEMRVGGGTWWSVCLEADGENEDALPEALRRVASVVFGGGDPPSLPPERAMSYVRWLAEEATKGGAEG